MELAEMMELLAHTSDSLKGVRLLLDEEELWYDGRSCMKLNRVVGDSVSACLDRLGRALDMLDEAEAAELAGAE